MTSSPLGSCLLLLFCLLPGCGGRSSLLPADRPLPDSGTQDSFILGDGALAPFCSGSTKASFDGSPWSVVKADGKQDVLKPYPKDPF